MKNQWPSLIYSTSRPSLVSLVINTILRSASIIMRPRKTEGDLWAPTLLRYALASFLSIMGTSATRETYAEELITESRSFIIPKNIKLNSVNHIRTE